MKGPDREKDASPVYTVMSELTCDRFAMLISCLYLIILDVGGLGVKGTYTD